MVYEAHAQHASAIIKNGARGLRQVVNPGAEEGDEKPVMHTQGLWPQGPGGL